MNEGMGKKRTIKGEVSEGLTAPFDIVIEVTPAFNNPTKPVGTVFLEFIEPKTPQRGMFPRFNHPFFLRPAAAESLARFLLEAAEEIRKAEVDSKITGMPKNFFAAGRPNSEKT